MKIPCGAEQKLPRRILQFFFYVLLQPWQSGLASSSTGFGTVLASSILAALAPQIVHLILKSS